CGLLAPRGDAAVLRRPREVADDRRRGVVGAGDFDTAVEMQPSASRVPDLSMPGGPASSHGVNPGNRGGEIPAETPSRPGSDLSMLKVPSVLERRRALPARGPSAIFLADER